MQILHYTQVFLEKMDWKKEEKQHNFFYRKFKATKMCQSVKKSTFWNFPVQKILLW